MIEFKEVSFKYEDTAVFENLNLKINKGDFMYILGPNGGGKSTLVKLVSKTLKPNSGKVINGAKKIGYMSQILRFKSNFPASVFEIIYSGFEKQYLFAKKEQKTRIDKLLSDMNILDLKNKLISELSGGQLQRVLFLRSIVDEPDLLILDEPASALDPKFRHEFYQYLYSLSQTGTTVLIITHDLSGIDVLECKDRVIYVEKAIVYDGIFCDFHKQILNREKHAIFS